MKKGTKYTLIVVASILCLLCALLLFTQTAYFKDKAKTELVKLLEAKLKLYVEIEELEGNWYNSIAIKNIKILDSDSIAARIQLLEVNYQLLPLLRYHVEIDSIVIKEPNLYLKQQTDSSWNWNSVITPTQTKQKKSVKLQPDFKVDLGVLLIKNGSITIDSRMNTIPQKIKGLNISANGSYSKNKQYYQLQHLFFSTQNPSIELKNLSGECTINNSGIQVDSLLIVTANSDVESKGKFENIENNFADLRAGTIDKDELALFIPQLKLLCSPSLKGAFRTSDNSFSAQVELAHKNEIVKIDVSLNDISNLISKKGEAPYTSTIWVENFNLGNWIETEGSFNFPYGEIKLIGADLQNFRDFTNIEAHFSEVTLLDYVMDSCDISAIYLNDSVSAQATIVSQFGDLNISGNMSKLFDEPEYEASIACHNIDINKLVPELIGTFVNGEIVAKGKGFKSNDLFADARIKLVNSSVYTIPIDSLNATLSLDADSLLIDSLIIAIPGGTLNGSGTLDFDSLYLETLVYGDISSIDMIDSIVDLPIVFDSVTTITMVSGPVRYLNIGGVVEVYNAKGYSSEIDRADADYLVEILEDSVNVHVNTSALNAEIIGLVWDSTFVDLNYADSKVDIMANLNWLDTIDASFETSINLGDTMSLLVPKVEINTIVTQFFTPDTVQAHIYNYEKIEIEKLSIKDINNPSFTLDANGTIANDEAIDFSVLIKQFQLEKLNVFLADADSIKGIFETTINVFGEPQNPTIEGEIEIIEPKIREYPISSLRSTFNYENKKGSLQLIACELGESLTANLSAHFDAYIDSLKLVFNPPETFEGSIIIDSLDASKSLAAFVPNDSIKGIFNGQIEARGDWEKPLLYGSVNLFHGQYINKDLGVEYNNIETSLLFDGKTVKLDTVIVRQKDGLISVSGEVEFDSTMISGNIKSSSLQLDANRFFLTQHRNYEILIDANTFIKTANNKPEYGGEIKVLRSDVYLPALIPDSKTDIENDIPLLVEAIRESADSIGISLEQELIESRKSMLQSNFAKELKGRLNVEIPRNTWVRSDDMRAELSGELEIAKTGPYFEIFGNIDVTRGQYILYGRKLDIQESQIVFQGGQQLNPVLDIKAEYIFRGSDKEKRYLQLLVNGEMSDPDITFILDDNEITETNGISILIFGVTSDEIGYSGQNSILNSMGSNAVASVITSQLSRTLGTQLKLDMIEITATENWQSAAFVVGKYITNDIFVIYQRGFGEVDGDEITPENITIEYELNDKLFLRLMSGSSKESGVDVILKFEEGNKFKRAKKE